MKNLRNRTTTPVQKGNIPNKEIAFFSLGMFGQNLIYGMMSSWLLYYCTDVLFMDGYKAGIILAIARIWDGINDPLVGMILDKVRFKSGEKFRPLLKYLPIPMGVLGILVFTDLKQAEAFNIFFVLVMYLLWDTVYSFQDTAMWSMSSVMSPHSDERARLIQWVQIAASAGGAVAGVGGAITLLLSAKAALGMTESSIFFLSALIFMGGGSLLTYALLKGKERVRSEVTASQHSMFSHLRVALNNKMLLLLIVAWLLSALMPALNQTYFFRHMVTPAFASARINGEQIMLIQGILMIIPGFSGMLFARRLAAKLGGMRNMVLFAAIVNIVARVLAFMVGYDTLPKFAFLTLMLLFSNIFAGTIGIAVNTLWGDSVDYGEWKSGVRTEGIAYSMKNFVAKMQSAIQSLIGGGLLTALQYNKLAEEAGQMQQAVFYDWLWPIYILGPIVASVLMMIPVLLLKYPKELQEQVEAELIERRAKAGIDVLPEV